MKNAALASYTPPGPRPKSRRPTVRLSSSASRRAPRTRRGLYATQLEALANAHTQVPRSL